MCNYKGKQAHLLQFQLCYIYIYICVSFKKNKLYDYDIMTEKDVSNRHKPCIELPNPDPGLEKLEDK